MSLLGKESPARRPNAPREVEGGGRPGSAGVPGHQRDGRTCLERTARCARGFGEGAGAEGRWRGGGGAAVRPELARRDLLGPMLFAEPAPSRRPPPPHLPARHRDSHSRTFRAARTCWGAGLRLRHLAVPPGPAQNGRGSLQGARRGGTAWSPLPHGSFQIRGSAKHMAFRMGCPSPPHYDSVEGLG